MRNTLVGLLICTGVASAQRLQSGACEPAQRRLRADLIKISDLYFDAIEQSSGSVAPFDDNCNHLENGMRAIGVQIPCGLGSGWE